MGNVLAGLKDIWSYIPTPIKNEMVKNIPSEIKQVHEAINSILNPPAFPEKKEEDDAIEVEWTEVGNGGSK